MDNVGPIREDDITTGNLKNLKFPCIRVTSDLNKKRRQALGNTSKPRAKKPKLSTTTTHDVNVSRNNAANDDTDGLAN
jgi:hypothetical protein